MKIDIISYSSDQYALLGEEQLQEIRSAQVKKNKLERALEEKIQKEKVRLINNGIFYSKTWALTEAALRADYEEEVAWIKQALLFSLRYSNKPEETSSNPYPLDYSLDDEARLNVVRNYYETTYTNGSERFTVFKEDDVARAYLGELYKPLYDYYLELSKK